MNTRNLLLLASVVALGSCTSVYKSGQTPDDVYYSPGQQKEGYVQAKNNQENNQPYSGSQPSDDYLRMKVQDPNKWSTLDYDMYGNYSPYSSFGPYGMYSPYGMYNPYGIYSPYGGLGYSSFYSPFGWNSFLGFGMYYGSYYNPYYYNPYYYAPAVVIVKPSVTTNPYINGPRKFNSMAGYGNTAYVAPTGKMARTNSTLVNGTTPVRVFGNTSSTGSNSGYLRGTSSGSIFRPSGNSGSSPTRSFEPRSSSSGSTGTRSGGSFSGGSSGSAPVRSFGGRR